MDNYYYWCHDLKDRMTFAQAGGLGWASFIAGLIPSQGTFLGCGLDPQCVVCRR